MEKTFVAERDIARVRPIAVAIATVWVVAEGRRDAATIGVLAVAAIYALGSFALAPYRRNALASARITAAIELVLIALLIFATGGIESPWYLAYYVEVIALAFRFGPRGTVVAGLGNAGAYAVVLAVRGELGAAPVEVGVRLGVLAVEVAICALLAREWRQEADRRADTERLASQAENAEARLRGILQAARTPILVFDVGGRVQFVNEQAHALFRADLEGATLEDVFQRFRASSNDSVKSREGATWDRPLRVLRTGGDVREVLISVSEYSDPGGQPAGMIAVCYDVTEEKRVEKRMKQQRLRAEEAERRRIGSELHDEVGQILTGIKLALDAPRPSLEEARRLVDDLLLRVRNLSLDLRPSVLDDLGLVPALLWHIERYTAQTGVRVDFKQTGLDRRFSQDLETAAYRLVQEALTNVARHAGVREATVRAWADKETLTVQVEDRGKGFDPGQLVLGASGGLTGMRERAQLVGGSLTLDSTSGGGTRIAAEMPIGERLDAA